MRCLVCTRAVDGGQRVDRCRTRFWWTRSYACGVGLFESQEPRPIATLWEKTVVEWQQTLKVGVPALCYVIQNNLIFVAATELDAPVFQVKSGLWVVGCLYHVALPCRHTSRLAVTTLFWCSPATDIDTPLTPPPPPCRSCTSSS